MLSRSLIRGRDEFSPGPWKAGRATLYGADVGDDICQIACTCSYIWAGEPLGGDIAALNDGNAAYMDSCSTCYDVSCTPLQILNGYRLGLGRLYSCKDTKHGASDRFLPLHSYE